MSTDKARVIVAVSGHWLFGAVPSKGSRVQDVLNDEGSEFLRLQDVQVYRDRDAQVSVATLPRAMLLKQNIELVVLSEESHEAPVKRWNNFAVRATSDVFAIVGGHCVQGELQLPPAALDPFQALTQQLGGFFPVTHANVLGAGKARMSVPVLFINKRFLSCVHVGDGARAEARRSACSEVCATRTD